MLIPCKLSYLCIVKCLIKTAAEKEIVYYAKSDVFNNCSRTIMLSVNEGDEIAILPKQTISMLIDTYDILKVHMRQKNKSNLQKKHFKNRII